MTITLRRLARLFCLLPLFASTLHAQAPATTTISDVVYRANGTPAAGTLLISWPAFTSADSRAVAAGSMSLAIGPAGAVTVLLVPNQGATPAGTSYKVIYKLDDGTTATENWVVPTVGPTAISSIRATTAPTTTAVAWGNATEIQGVPVASTPPQEGQGLFYHGVPRRYEPMSPFSGDATFSGSLALGTTVFYRCGGVDDSAGINAKLALGGHVKLIGASCKVGTALSVPSNTWLEVSPDTTLSFKTGSSGNMVINANARTPQRSVTDAAISSGDKTLTSATAAFTAADVGRTVRVADAYATGWDLTAKIASVTSATEVELDTAAGASVSSKSLTIWNRDANIRVSGGTWARGTAGGVLYADLHTLYFRHVDGLTVENLTCTSGAAKFCVSTGDVTRLRGSRLHFASFSDGIHVTGPASDVVIREVSGTTGDDSVALTPIEYQTGSDVGGTITDVHIADVNATSAMAVFKIGGGKLRNTILRNLSGLSTGNNYVVLVDDTYGGGADIDGLLIDGVQSTSSIDLQPTTGGTAVVLNYGASPITAGTATHFSTFLKGPAMAGANNDISSLKGLLWFGANQLDLRNGTNAQALYVYNTADATLTDWERGYFRWAANIFVIGTEKGGTGTARNLQIASGGTTGIVSKGNISMTVNSSGNWLYDGAVQTVQRLKLTTVATPTCDSSSRGTFHFLAGGAGAKDTVEVCAKDNADTYGWRPLY